ncbi:hypothetical protein DMENIID0001_049930 [Sergentomyia squamirostris]
MAQRGPRFLGPRPPNPPNAPRRFGQNPQQPRWIQNQVEKRKHSPQKSPLNSDTERKKKKPKFKANSEKLEILYKNISEILSNTRDDNAIISLMRFIQPTQQQTHEILRRVTEDLRNVLSKSFSYYEIHPFGSAVTGLLMKDSDLDFYVRVPDNRLNNIEQLLKEVEKSLWRSRVFTKVIKIPRARVPLLKFYYPEINVYCDVNFTNSMGIHSSAFIHHLIQSDYRIYPLMMVVKFWATTHELSGTGRITNYCLTMMVIFFLQTLSNNPILPSVDEFQQNVPMVDISGWNVAFNKSLRSTMINMSCLGKLLGEFYEFIASYDFVNMMMCPLFGKSYKKEAFAPAVKPPAEFLLYQQYVVSHPEDTFPHEKSLCVQDPFELKINIGGCCSPKHLRKFITSATYAARIFYEGDINKEPLSKILMRLFFENTVNIPSGKSSQKCGNKVQMHIPGVDSKNVLTMTLMPSRHELKILREIVQQRQIFSQLTMKVINKFWVDTMARFLVTILKEIYLLTLEVENQPGSSSNPSDYPKMFLTSTETNVWTGRRSTPGTIDAEKAESQRHKAAIQPKDPIKFTLVVNTNNDYEYLQVSCVDRLLVPNSIKQFHQHFVENIRNYLSRYLDNYRSVESNGEIKPTSERVITVKTMKKL